jgi:hypothetical protein
VPRLANLFHLTVAPRAASSPDRRTARVHSTEILETDRPGPDPGRQSRTVQLADAYGSVVAVAQAYCRIGIRRRHRKSVDLLRAPGCVDGMAGWRDGWMGMCSPVKAARGQKPWDLRNSIAWNTSQGAQGGLFLHQRSLAGLLDQDGALVKWQCAGRS